ncbi:hypothetical protein BDP27DRAFT_1468371 [Rhodocollybia butyracea]|uniref:Uncharacterized protein n=1 Tax=Rhodocollybia butyracea TaxID=206335 RepID=A0A9P5U4J8_9AGAR|nr:hypothetical protein BDP27DRAFT_1468371 [Rhodocollybia butyracea]
MYPPAVQSISSRESVYPRISNALLLPPDMMAKEAWANCSMPNLLSTWKPTMRGTAQHRQLIFHRGQDIMYDGIPDGSVKALLLATAGAAENTGNNAECDLVFLKRGAESLLLAPREPIIQHDLVADRQTLETGAWADFTPPPLGAPLPRFISREPGAKSMSHRYVDTLSNIVYGFSFLQEIVSKNRNATLIFDCRNNDCAEAASAFSYYPNLRQNAAIQFYGYTIRNYEDFKQKVLAFSPHADWKDIFYIPVMVPEVLPILAGLPSNSHDYSCMLNNAKNWFVSMITSGLNIAALSLGAVGIGKGVSLETMEVRDLKGEPVTDTKVKAEFIKDKVLLDLLQWIKTNYPQYPLIGISITYGFKIDDKFYTPAFHTGTPKEMPTGQAGQGWQLRAVPGNPFRLGFDWAICDRPYDNLNYILGTKDYEWPADVTNPERDIANAPSLNSPTAHKVKDGLRAEITSLSPILEGSLVDKLDKSQASVRVSTTNYLRDYAVKYRDADDFYSVRGNMGDND